MKTIAVLFLILCILSCNDKTQQLNTIKTDTQDFNDNSPFLIVLGTVQDAGSPQINCRKACCSSLFKKPDPSRKVVSLGIVDPRANSTYLIEATPDIAEQLKVLNSFLVNKKSDIPSSILLTHAHIGHYTGLMYLGKEATSSKKVPTYVMPRMNLFLRENGPWSQLVSQENISLVEINNGDSISLGSLTIIPIQVPHRDEFSETVGYKIIGPNNKVLFIPDIDKWSRWEKDIISMVNNVDVAYLDATFYNGKELNNRDMSQIPHPFVVETMAIFDSLNEDIRGKIHFIHFNHTNPLLNPSSTEYKECSSKKYIISSYLDRIQL